MKAVLMYGSVAMLALSVLLPSGRSQQDPQSFLRHKCMNNEKLIMLAIAMYSDSNQGRCPMDSANPTLVRCMQLLSNVFIHYGFRDENVPTNACPVPGNKTAEVFFCPEDRRPGARPEPDFKKLTTLNISYSYVPNLIWRDRPDSPVIMDRIYSTKKGSRWPADGNNGDSGGFVAFDDGHVSWQSMLPCDLKDKTGKQVVLSP
jgi:hypothetical protein